MTKPICKDLLLQLSNYIDGEVPPELMKELEVHIRDCENCRIVLDTTRKTISLFHQHAANQKAPGEMVEHLHRTLNLDDYISGENSNG